MSERVAPAPIVCGGTRTNGSLCTTVLGVFDGRGVEIRHRRRSISVADAATVTIVCEDCARAWRPLTATQGGGYTDRERTTPSAVATPSGSGTAVLPSRKGAA